MERPQPTNVSKMPPAQGHQEAVRRYPVQVRATFIRLPRNSAA